MKRVIDSSVAFKWVVPESDSGKALLLRDDFGRGLVDLVTPDIFFVELGHALTRAEHPGGHVDPAPSRYPEYSTELARIRATVAPGGGDFVAAADRTLRLLVCCSRGTRELFVRHCRRQAGE